MALIERADLLRELCKIPGSLDEDLELLVPLREIRKLINLMPTADETPIIRCSDCANWDTTWKPDYARVGHYCSMIDLTTSPDFFCAEAERRENQCRT